MEKRRSQKQQQQRQRQSGGTGTAEHALSVYGGINDQRAAGPNTNVIAMRAPGASPMQGGSSQNYSKKSKKQLQKSVKHQLQQLKQSGGSLGFSDYSSSVPAKPVDTFVSSGSPNTGLGLGLAPPAVGAGSSEPMSMKVGGKKGKKSKKGQTSQPSQTSQSSQSSQPSQSSHSDVVGQVAAALAGAATIANEARGFFTSADPNADPNSDNDAQTGGQTPLDLFNKVGGKLSKQQLQDFSQQLDKLQQQQHQQQQQQQGGVGLNEVIAPLLLMYANQRYAQGKTAKSNVKSMRRSMRKSRKVRR
jgi:hypothetical protein